MSSCETGSLAKKPASIDVFLLVVSLLLIYYTFLVVLNSSINPDEIEHLHSAWYIKNGHLPFKDFFQHHSPFFWYLLIPFPGLSSENANVLIHARVLMALFSLVTAGVASLCATKIGGNRTHGLLAFIIVLTVLFYVEKSTNVRPDGLSALFSTISLYFFLDTDRGFRRSVVLTGVFVSIAFLFSPKAVFACGFYVLYYATRIFRGKMSINLYFIFLTILLSPLIISIAYGYVFGSLQEYILCNYLLNVSKANISGRWTGLLPIFRENWFFWMAAIVGVVYSFTKRRENQKVMLLSLLGITIFAAAFKSSFYPQYYIPVVPIFAIVISIVVLKTVEHNRRKNILIILFVCGCLSAPIMSFEDTRTNKNAAKLEMLDYFAKATTVKDCVYDERREFNIFRRDAHYLWYHPALRAKYISLTGKYTSFNRCKVIRSKKPAAVDASLFRFSRCDTSGSYRESKYKGFFLLSREPDVGISPSADDS